MDKTLIGLLAIATIALPACATPRIEGIPELTKWSEQYGFTPYTVQGKDTYCHAPVGASGSFCIPSSEMVKLMANNEAPPVPRNAGTVEGDLQAGR